MKLVLLIALAACAKGTTPPAGIAWLSDEKAAFELARAKHLGVMVDLHADWAAPCLEIERELGDPRIASAIGGHFVAVKLDITQESDATEALRARYRSTTLPTLLFLTTDGTVIARVDTVHDVPELAGIVEQAAAKLHGPAR